MRLKATNVRFITNLKFSHICINVTDSHSEYLSFICIPCMSFVGTAKFTKCEA